MEKQADAVTSQERTQDLYTPSKSASHSIFKIPLSVRDCSNAIWSFTKNIVEGRGKEYTLTPEYRNAIATIAKFLVEEDRRFGLLVNGNPGNGKTTLAQAIAMLYDKLIDKGLLDLGSSMYGKNYMKVVNAVDLSRIYCEDQNSFRMFCGHPRIIIDDVGEDPKSVLLYGNESSPFVELIEYRYQQMLPTILFSNMTVNLFMAKYRSDRLNDRMREMFKVISINGNSFRR